MMNLSHYGSNAHKVTHLLEKLRRIDQFNKISAVLGWDQEVYMPQGGSSFRADQLACLAIHINQLWKDPLLKELLSNFVDLEFGSALNPQLPFEEKRFWEELWIDYRRQTAIPEKLAEAHAKACAISIETWQESIAQNNPHPFSTSLKELIHLSRELAHAIGDPKQKSLYDVHLDLYERGQKTETLTPAFEQLKKWTIHFLRNRNKPVIQSPPLSIALQEKLSLLATQWLQLPPDKTRLDKAPHPFCTTLGPSDIRITTRYREGHPLSSFFSTLHEGGHALHALYLPEKWSCFPVGERSPSLSVDESQSRLFEIMFGHSRPFLSFVGQELKKIDPKTPYSPELLYQITHQVHPSYIRVEADPVTYNLHIILRFEIERDLFSEALSVEDLPDAWNEKIESYLGLKAPAQLKDGCFQDIHWAHGAFGYFPTYTRGNLLAAQIYTKLDQIFPDLSSLLAKGEFKPIIQWLAEHIHSQGRFYTTDEIAQRTTGSLITPDAFISLMEKEY